MECNYKKIIEDFASGKLDPDKVALVIDNDDGYWVSLEPNAAEWSQEWEDTQKKWLSEMEAEYGSPNGYRDIVSVLISAGINAQWC